VEAMACNKAVLITDKVNIWREISDGKGGLVQNDDYHGINALLTEWSGFTTEEKSLYGHNAFAVYEEHFSVGHASQRLKEVLDKQLK